MDTAEGTSPSIAQTYDGFISYSHAADDLLAPRLQSALQRFAKPWWKRRAVRIFRDESSLSANPHLWSSITEALDKSGWFVLLLSQDAAASEWVNQEIAYWVEHRDPKKILPVVTDGDFGWANDEVTGDAVPESLRGAFEEEPRWVDVRWAKEEDQLDLQDPRFADAVADIASTIRGVPKDDLASEEVRQHRRTVRTAWGAGMVTAALAVAAVGFGIDARNERSRADEEAARATVAAEQEAQARALAEANAETARENETLAEQNAEQAQANAEEAQRNAELAEARELAASAIGVVDDDPELAILLALAAIRSTPEGAEQPVEVINSLWKATGRNRLAGSITPGLGDGYLVVTLSADGSRMLISDRSEAIVVDPASGEEFARYVLGTEDEIRSAVISPDGTFMALPVAEPDALFSSQGRGGEDDPRPARLVITSASSGEELTVIEYPGCRQVDTPAWSSDGAMLAVSSGPEPCPRDGSPSGLWVEVYDTATWESIAVVDSPSDEGWEPVPSWDQTGRLFLFSAAPTKYLDPTSPSDVSVLEGTFGFGHVSPDGGTVVSSLWEYPEIQLRSAGDGRLLDVLPIEFYPNVPWELRFSSEGSYVAAGIRGVFVTVWDADRGTELFTVPGAAPIIDEQAGILYATDGPEVKRWTLAEGTAARRVIGDLGDTPWVNGRPTFQLSDSIGAFLAAPADFSSFVVRFFERATGELLDVRFEEPSNGPITLDGDRFLIESDNDWYVFDPVTGGRELYHGCENDVDGVCPDGSPSPDDVAIRRSWDGEQLASASVIPAEPYDRIGVWAFREAGSGDLLPDDSSTWPVYEDGSTVYGINEFSDDWVLLSDDQSDALALDRSSGEILWEAPTSVVHTGAHSETGLLWVFGADGLLTRLDPSTWEETGLDLGLGNVRAISFSPDASLVAAGDQDVLKVFDVPTGSLRHSIPIGGVSDVFWLSNDRIVIGTNSGLWAELSLDPEDLIAASLDSVTRPLTADECAFYRIDPCPTLEELRNG